MFCTWFDCAFGVPWMVTLFSFGLGFDFGLFVFDWLPGIFVSFLVLW